MAKLSWLERWWMNAWPHRWHVFWHVPRFLQAAPEPFRGEVLEVGAGRGWTSRRILETFPQVDLTAVDMDPVVSEAFRKLKARYGNRLHVVCADAAALPFDREGFDVVLAMNVVRHLGEAERERALTELLRVLRPGGWLGISEAGGALDAQHHARWQAVQAWLAEEKCDVRYVRAEFGFDVWARKPYHERAELTE